MLPQRSCTSSSNQVFWAVDYISQLKKEIPTYILSPEELRDYGYPVVNPDKTITVKKTPYPKDRSIYDYIIKKKKEKKDYSRYFSSPNLQQVECDRCLESFYVNNNQYIEFESCQYHWGKFKNELVCENGFTKKYYIWTCCEKFGLTKHVPCCESVSHVWSGLMPGVNDVTHKYKILATESCENCESCGIYSIDCEMCYTHEGLEVVQVSLVDINGDCVYKTYVKPSAKIIDYNTEYSGVTKEIMDNVNTTLEEVHQQLKRFIHKKTVLIGHALENDLRALHIVHDKCIDTSILYLDKFKPFPYRKSLKHLAEKVLGRSIQKNAHDSEEDARATFDIVKDFGIKIIEEFEDFEY